MARRAKFDPLRAVEACYASAGDERVWLEGILSTVAPLELGPGSYAKVFDLADPMDQRFAVVGNWAHAAQLLEAGRGLATAVGADGYRALHAPAPPVELFSSRLSRLPTDAAAPVLGFMKNSGIGDSLGVLAGDLDGRGVLLSLCLGPGRQHPTRLQGQLGRIAGHLVAARRLRERIGAGLAGAEAVLEPNGALAHADGDAREPEARRSLCAAVQAMERARGRLRATDPEEALSLWKGLVEGRWSLVETVESDGRRLILARGNAPGVRDVRALTQRERAVAEYAALGHANKFIAYLLGLAPSTVATHLAKAQSKLGLASRRELIETFAAAATTPSPGERLEAG